jgi:dTDP-4-dehydrorhamnose reductase
VARIASGLSSNTVIRMAEPTILLLGCNGQLGFELQRSLPSLGHLIACDFPEIDFSRTDGLRALVRKVRPGVIVNAAAYTAVDKAESDEEMARRINAMAPAVLADEAEAAGAVIVHYSTDYVFDGTKTAPYVETDPTNPLSVYGLTKRDGERNVVRCRRHLIFRTSWVVGFHGANFIKSVLRLAGERETLRVVADQFGAPTSAKLLAEVTAKVLALMIASPAEDPRWGLYHLVAQGETSWNGFARHVIGRAIAQGLALKLSPDAVAEITSAEYPTAAERPANSRLDTHKLRAAFGVDLPDWTEGADDVLDRIVVEMRT